MIFELLSNKPEVSLWKVHDVIDWAEKANLSDISNFQSFIEQSQVDGSKLLNLTEEELSQSELKFTSLGKRKKIMRAIAFLKANLIRSNGISVFIGGGGTGF